MDEDGLSWGRTGVEGGLWPVSGIGRAPDALLLPLAALGMAWLVRRPLPPRPVGEFAVGQGGPSVMAGHWSNADTGPSAPVAGQPADSQMMRLSDCPAAGSSRSWP